ncbi:MAG: hypothetical protein ACUVX1_15655 [Chloroflexota bacterium]
MPPLWPDLLLDPTHLFDPNPGPPSAIYFVYAVIFLAVVGVGAYGYFVVRPTFGNKLRRYYADILSRGAMIVGGIGLVIVLLRFLTVPVVSARILVYFWLLVTVGYSAFVVYFLYRIQPRRLREYQQAFTRAQFRPRPRATRGGKKKRRK